ncbi:MAG: GNAT family N-acetyltransferase [Asticcacaulis sp.]|nr:GNAT family N-acetyltransferase [Asticcacaulis sp.]
MSDTDTIERLRAFNRFYTRRIGLLSDRPYGGDFTLTEVRVLFELAHHGPLKPSDMVEQLGLDPAYVSRIVKRFDGLGLVARQRDPDDGRGVILSLTEKGRETFAPMDAVSRETLGRMIGHLGGEAQAALARSAQRIEQLLGGDGKTWRMRDLQVGDIGHVTARQALLYHREYGWDISYEGLVAGLFADFIRNFDPSKEASFIAEKDGEVVGSVFLFRGDEDGVAKLRLLYVEPETRGLGIGRALVEACIAAARQRGYRRMVLWTQNCLGSARKIYQAAGFELVSEQTNHQFGADLVSQVWGIDL